MWSGLEWCGVEFWSLQKLIFVFKYRYPQFWNTAIPKKTGVKHKIGPTSLRPFGFPSALSVGPSSS